MAGMEAFAGASLVVAFIAYCHFTKETTRQFHLAIVWGLMFLSIVGTLIYHVVRELLR